MAPELRVLEGQSGSTRAGGTSSAPGWPPEATGSLGNHGPCSQVPGLRSHLGAAVPTGGVSAKGHEER